MVPHPRKTPRANSLKYVNYPQAIRVTEDKEGVPQKIEGELVESIEDCWRIDDEWWRNQAISRMYFALTLTSGRHLTVYKDLLETGWHRQLY